MPPSLPPPTKGDSEDKTTPTVTPPTDVEQNIDDLNEEEDDEERQTRLAEVEAEARLDTTYEPSPSSSASSTSPSISSPNAPTSRPNPHTAPSDPSPSAAVRPPSKHAQPFGFPVLVMLIPSSMLGLLARLGLEALGKYDGQSVFALGWVQGVGCFVMGVVVGLREPISQLYVIRFFGGVGCSGDLMMSFVVMRRCISLLLLVCLLIIQILQYTNDRLRELGFCGSLTTFATWNLQIFEAWENAGGHHRVWLYDVSTRISIPYPRSNLISFPNSINVN